MKHRIRDYLRDRTEPGIGFEVLTKELYRDYQDWCQSRRISPTARRNFITGLQSAGFPPFRQFDGHTVVNGLALKGQGGVGRRPFLVLSEALTASDVAALKLVVAELERQRTEDKHSAGHDDVYPLGILETAGAEYLMHAGYSRRDDFPPGAASDSWPWSAESWKPKSPLRDAERGCALGIAGIAHRLRAGERAEG